MLIISPRLISSSLSDLLSLSAMIICIFPKSPFPYLSSYFWYRLNIPLPLLYLFLLKYRLSFPPHLMSTFWTFPQWQILLSALLSLCSALFGLIIYTIRYNLLNSLWSTHSALIWFSLICTLQPNQICLIDLTCSVISTLLLRTSNFASNNLSLGSISPSSNMY